MEIIKTGVLDTIQDAGRFGFAHLGVGTGGCMDKPAGKIANILVGNPEDGPVLEMHFPAPAIFFKKGAIIALSGADFNGVAHGVTLPVNRRIELPPGTTLEFDRKQWGQRCYLAVAGGWHLEPVMGSFSTHLKGGFGGWKGRALKKGDIIPGNHEASVLSENPLIAKWFVYTSGFYTPGPIRVLPGPEWDWLGDKEKKHLLNESFHITRQSDRMGYLLKGNIPISRKGGELLSSGVMPGTIQLLPDGHPLILMADCQTTGGYPRILQVAAVDLPKLAQLEAGDTIEFTLIDMARAITLLKSFQSQLIGLKGAVHFSR